MKINVGFSPPARTNTAPRRPLSLQYCFPLILFSQVLLSTHYRTKHWISSPIRSLVVRTSPSASSPAKIPKNNPSGAPGPGKLHHSISNAPSDPSSDKLHEEQPLSARSDNFSINIKKLAILWHQIH